ncbi:hypothetical protein ACJX0J_033101, partial [Zea mays]
VRIENSSNHIFSLLSTDSNFEDATSIYIAGDIILFGKGDNIHAIKMMGYIEILDSKNFKRVARSLELCCDSDKGKNSCDQSVLYSTPNGEDESVEQMIHHNAQTTTYKKDNLKVAHVGTNAIIKYRDFLFLLGNYPTFQEYRTHLIIIPCLPFIFITVKCYMIFLKRYKIISPTNISYRYYYQSNIFYMTRKYRIFINIREQTNKMTIEVDEDNLPHEYTDLEVYWVWGGGGGARKPEYKFNVYFGNQVHIIKQHTIINIGQDHYRNRREQTHKMIFAGLLGYY